jgi:hypothetical protein
MGISEYLRNGKRYRGGQGVWTIAKRLGMLKIKTLKSCTWVIRWSCFGITGNQAQKGKSSYSWWTLQIYPKGSCQSCTIHFMTGECSLVRLLPADRFFPIRHNMVTRDNHLSDHMSVTNSVVPVSTSFHCQHKSATKSTQVSNWGHCLSHCILVTKPIVSVTTRQWLRQWPSAIVSVTISQWPSPLSQSLHPSDWVHCLSHQILVTQPISHK